MLFYFLLFYIISQFIILNYLYFKIKVYYSPSIYRDKETGKKIDVHKLYEAFQAKDELVYWKIILGGMIFFPIKFIFNLCILMAFIIYLNIFHFFYKNFSSDENNFNKYAKGVKFFVWMFYNASMINLEEIKINCENIYKKYLGPNYNFKNEKYSLLISNHIGFYDTIINLYLHPCSFIAKKEISSFPIFCTITKLINCIFVDRKNEISRKDMLNKIHERQIQYYNKESFIPLLIYPEGSTTCGRNILKFKKGAFAYLLPVKPNIITIDQKSKCHLASGCQDMLLNTLKFFCYFSVNMYYIDMPVIRPTEFMYENYSSFGKEKWEIYAEVTRKIFCEVGGFKECDQGYRESHKYGQTLIKGIYEED